MTTHTAVVALHYQNSVIHPEGEVGKLGNAAQCAARDVLANVRRVFGYARDAGAPVIHIGGGCLTNHPGVVSSSPLFRSAFNSGAFTRGTWGASFHEEAAPAPGEAALYHTGLLSFPGTGLKKILDDYAVRRVLVFGVATRLVVEAAVFEFTDHGYETCLVEDCCASARAELHEQSIEIMRLFAKIVSSRETEALFSEPA